MKKLNVLIVDDDLTSRLLLSQLVKPYSSKIVMANDGLDGVNVCRKNNDIDLILMDIKMPRMNGYEAMQEIRKFNSTVFIIAQTAYAHTGDREKSFKAGGNEFITKPINRSLFVEIIEKFVDNLE